MTCEQCQSEMTSATCEQCGWMLPEARPQDKPKTIDDYVRSTVQDHPKGITLDEFGRDLYAAIKTIGSMLAVQQHYAQAVFVDDRLKAAEYQSKRRILLDQLQPQLAALSTQDCAEIAQRYPWILHV